MKTTKAQNIYTYKNWTKGRFSTGGTQVYENSEDFGKRQMVPFVSFGTLNNDEADKIKEEQKRIFCEDVEFYITRLKDGFKLMYSESGDKANLIIGTLNELRNLFTKRIELNYLELPHINKMFTRNEVEIIQNFYTNHILRGKRNYLFIQSREQLSPTFRNPPIQVEAQVLFTWYEYLNAEFANVNQSLSLREVALVCIYTKRSVNRNNSNALAKEFGLQSGHKLYQYYNIYFKSINRTGVDESAKKTENKINMLVKIVEYLQQRGFDTINAINDLEKLKEAYEREPHSVL